jgi:hypothetical protein
VFIVAENVQGNVWRGITGIFAAEEAARGFYESLQEKWKTDQSIFPVPELDAYPFFLTGQGLELGSVRPIGETELQQLLAQVERSEITSEWRILFNVYSVLGDSFNKVFPGESVLPKIGHYHVTAEDHGYDQIRSYLLRLPYHANV